MKNRVEHLTLGAFAIFCFMLLSSMVQAQEAVDTRLNLGDLVAPWLEMLVGAAAILITAILGWVAALIKKKTGVDIDLARMQTLQTALNNAAGILIAKAGSAADKISFDVRHPAIRDAILYVNAAAPDAVAHFGLTPEQIAEKITAKLGVATAPTVVTTEG